MNSKVTTIAVAGATVYFPTGCSVKAIRWQATDTSQTVAGDIARIDDHNGALLWRVRSAGADHEVESITERHWPAGFKVATLEHGELDVETFAPGTSVF